MAALTVVGPAPHPGAGPGAKALCTAIVRLNLLTVSTDKLLGCMLPDMRLLALLFGEQLAAVLFWTSLCRAVLFALLPGWQSTGQTREGQA